MEPRADKVAAAKRRFRPLFSRPHTCAYCGGPFQHRDHYLPWSVHLIPYWVPACALCNHTLGARWASSIGERQHLAAGTRWPLPNLAPIADVPLDDLHPRHEVVALWEAILEPWKAEWQAKIRAPVETDSDNKETR